MSYDYSENILVQHVRADKLSRDTADPVFSECSAAAQPVDDGFAAFRGAENAGKPPFHGVPPASQRGKVLSLPGRHPRHGEKAERSAGNEASRGDRLSKPGE